MMEEEKIDPREVKRYNRIKLALSVTSMLLGVGFLAAVLFFGFSAELAVRVSRITEHPFLAFLLFAFVLGSIETVIAFPLSFYGGFVVEHRFGLSNQSFGRWFWEEVKGLLVGLAIMTPLMMAFYLCLRRFPVSWWIPAGLVYFLFAVLLAQLGPLLIFPLFYTFFPVESDALKVRLRRLSENAGLIISDIYSFNLSKNTKKANAAFAGLGRTRRILLADTRLVEFSEDEIGSVIGHELGHYRCRHLWKGIVLGFIVILGGLGLSNLFYSMSMKPFGGVRGDELATLPLLALFLAGFGVAITPLQNAVSRHFERQGDGFAARETGYPEAFVSALGKLEKMNKADRRPHPVVEFFFYSHPALGKRIARIRSMEGV